MTHYFSGGVGEWGPKGRLKEEDQNNMTHYFSVEGVGGRVSKTYGKAAQRQWNVPLDARMSSPNSRKEVPHTRRLSGHDD